MTRAATWRVLAVLVAVVIAVSAACRNDRPPATRAAVSPSSGRAATASPAPAPPPRPAEPERAMGDGSPAEPRAEVPPRPMSRRAARELVEHVVAKRLGRELAPAEVEKLTDSVIRLRTAAQALRGADDSAAGVATRQEQRTVMLEALDDIAKATGLPPSELGAALAPSDDASTVVP